MTYTREELKRMMRNLGITSEYIRKLKTRPPSAFRKDSRTNKIHAIVMLHKSELELTFAGVYDDLLKNSGTYFTHLEEWNDFETKDLLKELSEHSGIKKLDGRLFKNIPKFYLEDKWNLKNPVNKLQIKSYVDSGEDEWHMLNFHFNTEDGYLYGVGLTPNLNPDGEQSL
jgi:hypothetical protein